MWLFDLLRRAAPAPAETKSAEPLAADKVVAAYAPLAALLTGGGGEMSPAEAWRLYSSVSTLAKVIDLIASQAADLAPIVTVDGEPGDVPEIAALLKRPGHNRTRRQLVEEAAVQMLVTGTGYLHAVGNIGRAPVALDVFRTKDTHVEEAADGYPAQLSVHEAMRSFVFRRDAAGTDYRMVDGRLSEALAVFDRSGTRKGVGVSPLSAIRDDLDLRVQGYRHNASMMRKGARPSGVLSTSANLTPEQKADVKAQAKGALTGPDNAGAVMVLTGGEFNFAQLGISPKDMDWALLSKLVEDAIVARFNVPLALFSPDAQTYDNFRTATEVFYQNAVLPVWRAFHETLARCLSQRTGRDIGFTFDPLTVNALADRLVERVLKLVKEGLITRNEGRADIGREPMDGADRLYVAATMIPIDAEEMDGALPMPDLDADDEDDDDGAGGRGRSDGGRAAGQRRGGARPQAPARKAAAPLATGLRASLARRLG